MNREERKIIAQETLSIIENGKYTIDQDIVIEKEIQFAIDNTVFYDVNDLDDILNAPKNKGFETKIEVIHEDSVSCIHRLAKETENVGCLNFASAKNAGGGFLNGAIAQEESLAISSALYAWQQNANAYYDKHRAMKSCIYSDA